MEERAPLGIYTNVLQVRCQRHAVVLCVLLPVLPVARDSLTGPNRRPRAMVVLKEGKCRLTILTIPLRSMKLRSTDGLSDTPVYGECQSMVFVEALTLRLSGSSQCESSLMVATVGLEARAAAACARIVRAASSKACV